MEPTPKRKKLQQLKMAKRVGVYTSDPDNQYLGIFKAPKDQQKEFRKGVKAEMKEVKRYYKKKKNG